MQQAWANSQINIQKEWQQILKDLDILRQWPGETGSKICYQDMSPKYITPVNSKISTSCDPVKTRYFLSQKINLNCFWFCLGTYHYYINLESCTGVLNPGARYMYAVDDACTKVYRFDEIYGSWEVDLKVCASPRCNLYCSHKKYDPKEECNPNAKCPHSTHLL